MASGTDDSGEAAGALLIGVVAVASTVLVFIGRLLIRGVSGLLVRAFGYYPHWSLRVWSLGSAILLGLALLVAILTESLAAWLSVGGAAAIALGSLAVLEQTLSRLAALPPVDEPLRFSLRWHDDGAGTTEPDPEEGDRE